MADKRTEALTIFNDVSSWADSSHTAYVQYWNCLVSLEQEVLSGILAKEDFTDALTACNGYVYYANKNSNTSSPGKTEKDTELQILSADEIGSDSNFFSVYPNPTNGVFTVEADLISDVYLYNLLGNLILHKRTSDKERKLCQFDMSGFPKGIYLVKVINGESASVKRIVHQ